MKPLTKIINYLVESPLFVPNEPKEQEPMEFLTVTPSCESIAANGGIVSHAILSTNTPWSAITSEDWIHLVTCAGSSGKNQLISYVVTANTHHRVRHALITIRSGNLSKNIQIVQAGNLD